ncbi:MAG: hypothetical protein C4290_10610, partial [Chloroflexota bacterium]
VQAAAPITITARDYSFDALEGVSAGPVSFTLRNEGQEAHYAQFARLTDGVTLEQFGAALREGPSAAFPLVTFRGGPSVTQPGQTSFQVTLDLEPGTSMMLCFVESPDGVPHVTKGMMRPFVVSPPPTVVMRDFAFDVPEIRAGVQTLRVVNRGPQAHEMVIARVADDVTPEQIAEALQRPEAPPFSVEDLSGMQALSAGLSGWVTVDFTPGTMFCSASFPTRPPASRTWRWGGTPSLPSAKPADSGRGQEPGSDLCPRPLRLLP